MATLDLTPMSNPKGPFTNVKAFAFGMSPMEIHEALPEKDPLKMDHNGVTDVPELDTDCLTWRYRNRFANLVRLYHLVAVGIIYAYLDLGTWRTVWVAWVLAAIALALHALYEWAHNQFYENSIQLYINQLDYTREPREWVYVLIAIECWLRANPLWGFPLWLSRGRFNPFGFFNSCWHSFNPLQPKGEKRISKWVEKVVKSRKSIVGQLQDGSQQEKDPVAIGKVVQLEQETKGLRERMASRFPDRVEWWTDIVVASWVLFMLVWPVVNFVAAALQNGKPL